LEKNPDPFGNLHHFSDVGDVLTIVGLALACVGLIAVLAGGAVMAVRARTSARDCDESIAIRQHFFDEVFSYFVEDSQRIQRRALIQRNLDSLESRNGKHHSC
jgi:hypothetical protein